MSYFLHAGEAHQDVVETAQHTLEIESYIIIPLILLVVFLVLFLIYKVSKSMNVVILTAMALLFLLGIFSYSVLPTLGAIAIVLGFILSLAVTFGALQRG